MPSYIEEASLRQIPTLSCLITPVSVQRSFAKKMNVPSSNYVECGDDTPIRLIFTFLAR